MRGIMLRLLIVFILFGSIYSLSCPCQRNKRMRDSCKEPKNCLAGITFDACGCCKVCAQAEDEICEGAWGMYGHCGEDLECIKPENLTGLDLWQTPGICKPADLKK